MDIINKVILNYQYLFYKDMIFNVGSRKDVLLILFYDFFQIIVEKVGFFKYWDNFFYYFGVFFRVEKVIWIYFVFTEKSWKQQDLFVQTWIIFLGFLFCNYILISEEF